MCGKTARRALSGGQGENPVPLPGREPRPRRSAPPRHALLPLPPPPSSPSLFFSPPRCSWSPLAGSPQCGGVYMSRRSFRIPLASTLVLIAACSAVNDAPVGQGAPSKPVLSEKAHVAEATDAPRSNSRRLVFPSTSKFAKDLTSGDLVVSGYEGGFIRRVQSVEASGNDLVVHTADASLEDVIVTGTIGTNTDTSLSGQSVRPPARTQGLGEGELNMNFKTDLSGGQIGKDDGLNVGFRAAPPRAPFGAPSAPPVTTFRRRHAPRVFPRHTSPFPPRRRWAGTALNSASGAAPSAASGGGPSGPDGPGRGSRRGGSTARATSAERAGAPARSGAAGCARAA